MDNETSLGLLDCSYADLGVRTFAVESLEQNLTDEDDIQASAADGRQITQFQTYGTNYLLGFNYKF